MNTRHHTVAKLALGTVPRQTAGVTAADPGAALRVEPMERLTQEPTLASSHLRNLGIAVPVMVEQAIRAQLPSSA